MRWFYSKDLFKVKELRLSNDVLIPSIGFGTYRIPEDEDGVKAITDAFECGYRLIDGAAKYGNEKMVGRGLHASGIPRSDMFITSKVWATERGYDLTMKSFEKSLTDLGLDYLDMYLVHWPASPERFDDWREINSSTWKALETLLDLHCVRAIGVCNFKTSHLEPLLADANVAPMVDQVECNPGFRQVDLREWCSPHGIVVQAWSPLGRGRIFDNDILRKLACKYHKSVAQIALRWEIQSGMIPIPKSVNPERIRENIEVFDFQLTEEDVASIDNLPAFGASGLDPDTVDF